MADPTIQQSDLLQNAPETIISGDSYTFQVNLFQDDGTERVDLTATPTFNNGICSVRNLEDPDVEIDDPAVTITAIPNGATLSFQIDTSVLATYPVGRYVAKVSFLWDQLDDTESILLYFNVVGVTNPFK